MRAAGLRPRIEHGHTEAPATLCLDSRNVSCKLLRQTSGGSGQARHACEATPDNGRTRGPRKSTSRDHPLLLVFGPSMYREQED